MLVDDRTDWIVKRCRIGPVTNAPWTALVVENLLPVFFHLHINIQAHSTPHFGHDLRRLNLVGVIVIQHAVWNRLAFVTGLFYQPRCKLGVVLGDSPVLLEHAAVVLPL